MKKFYSMFTLNFVLLLFVGTFSLHAAADSLYKWTDEKGNVTYQSSPPPEDAAEVERPEINLTSTDEPAEEDADEPLPIKFFTKPDCPTCDQAREYFAENSVPTSEVDITVNKAEAKMMEKQLGHNDVPTILIGSRSITGFQKNILDNILKNAGYKLPTSVEEAEAAAEGSETETLTDETDVPETNSSNEENKKTEE